MSTIDALKDAFKLLAEEIRRIPDRVTRWARDQHQPVDVLGDGTLAICRACNVEWPCDEYVRLDAQVHSSGDA